MQAIFDVGRFADGLDEGGLTALSHPPLESAHHLARFLGRGPLQQHTPFKIRQDAVDILAEGYLPLRFLRGGGERAKDDLDWFGRICWLQLDA